MIGARCASLLAVAIFLLSMIRAEAATKKWEPVLPADRPPMAFKDGAIGTAPRECGLGDLCATLTLPNGDRIEIYNGGASKCKPYTLNVLRMHGNDKLFDYKLETDRTPDANWGIYGVQCGLFKDTFLTFDEGIATLGIFAARDGAIFGKWQGGESPAKS
jgi:hypothetical protein